MDVDANKIQQWVACAVCSEIVTEKHVPAYGARRAMPTLEMLTEPSRALLERISHTHTDCEPIL